ncbi:hydroxylamine oxidation protein HaoB [Oceanibacterium hippocampi]|uniref:Hydroxylamine oxidation protein HaoB n=1 Tax=Oceanibacterium hippocampi TaxID=745714 RepID=A0A1Y5TY13_9PROT|nr:hydroxylamine oxidation protein HaoB [Oceanibacterium hippocampi]SLN76624.1 hypothetical protein OCH7691_04151 [Oceanibacterium hippocampi]
MDLAGIPESRTAPGLATGIGVAMLIAGGILTVYALQAEDPPPPYVYEMAEAAQPSGDAQALAGAVPGATPMTVSVKTAFGGKVVARGEVLSRDGGPDLIVGWTSEIGEPVLRSDISVDEERRLVEALRTHLPADSLVYAMPALSGRLAAMLPARFPLAGADDRATVRLPDPWTGARPAILGIEDRWRPGPDRQADALFSAFVEALGAAATDGVARLRDLAEGRDSYLVLHVRDAFDLGVAAPERFSVGLRDFPGSGNVHDASKLVKTWVRDEGYAAYAVIRRDANALRAYYFADTIGNATLLGQLLPFSSARLGQVPDASLVFQEGGYWVYRLATGTIG